MSVSPAAQEAALVRDSPDWVYYGDIRHVMEELSHEHNFLINLCDKIYITRGSREAIDRPTIRVENPFGVKVGLLGENLSQDLSPYLDSGLLRILVMLDGTIENTSSQAGYPLVLQVFGWHLAEGLRTNLAKSRLMISYLGEATDSQYYNSGMGGPSHSNVENDRISVPGESVRSVMDDSEMSEHQRVATSQKTSVTLSQGTLFSEGSQPTIPLHTPSSVPRASHETLVSTHDENSLDLDSKRRRLE